MLTMTISEKEKRIVWGRCPRCDRYGPRGERAWDSDARDSLYDTLRHTEDYLDYPEHMRPIDGRWC